MGFAIVASACRPSTSSSRQGLSGYDAGSGAPADASGINTGIATVVSDPRAGHGNVNKPYKQVSQDQLVAELIHQYAKHATTIAHIQVSSTSSRKNNDVPPRIVTDFDYTAISLVVGSAPPAIRLTTLGGELGGVVERSEWSPRVRENDDFVAFFQERKGVWTLLGLLPCDSNGTITVYGESITLSQLQILIN